MLPTGANAPRSRAFASKRNLAARASQPPAQGCGFGRSRERPSDPDWYEPALNTLGQLLRADADFRGAS